MNKGLFLLWVVPLLVVACSSPDSTPPSVPYANRITDIAFADQTCKYTLIWGPSEDNKTPQDQLTYTVYVAKTDDRSAAPTAWEKKGEVVGATQYEDLVVAPGTNIYAYLTAKDEAGKESLPSAPMKLKVCVNSASKPDQGNPGTEKSAEEKRKEQEAAEKKRKEDEQRKIDEQRRAEEERIRREGAGPVGPITGKTENVCPALNQIGTQDYKAFGLEDWGSSSAIFRFNPYDEPLYTLSRKSSAAEDQCAPESFAGYTAKQDVALVNNFCDAVKPHGNVGARNIYVGKHASGPNLFLTKLPSGKLLNFIFYVSSEVDENMQGVAWGKVDEVFQYLGSSLMGWGIDLPTQASLGDPYALEIPSADKTVDGTSTVVADLKVASNPNASPTRLVAPIHDLIKACGKQSIIVGNFPELRKKIPQFKYGLTILQLHPNQEQYPGLILDADILIDIGAIQEAAKADQGTLENLLAWTVMRQLLFAFGADGNHSSTTPSLLLAAERDPTNLGELNWQFNKDSYEATVLFYLYGQYRPAAPPAVLTNPWDLLRDR